MFQWQRQGSSKSSRWKSDLYIVMKRVINEAMAERQKRLCFSLCDERQHFAHKCIVYISFITKEDSTTIIQLKYTQISRQ